MLRLCVCQLAQPRVLTSSDLPLVPPVPLAYARTAVPLVPLLGRWRSQLACARVQPSLFTGSPQRGPLPARAGRCVTLHAHTRPAPPVPGCGHGRQRLAGWRRWVVRACDPGAERREALGGREVQGERQGADLEPCLQHRGGERLGARQLVRWLGGAHDQPPPILLVDGQPHGRAHGTEDVVDGGWRRCAPLPNHLQHAPPPLRRARLCPRRPRLFRLPCRQATLSGVAVHPQPFELHHLTRCVALRCVARFSFTTRTRDTQGNPSQIDRPECTGNLASALARAPCTAAARARR
jgi:hypothetical protein